MSGGQDAIRGFVVQTMIALLRGLRNHDWDTCTLEPSSSTGTGEVDVVDIEWRGPGLHLHEQVKSSTAAFSAGQVGRWAGDLDARSTATSKRLTLVGLPSPKVKLKANHGRVSVEVIGQDADVLLTLLAHEISMMREGEGHAAPASESRRVAEQLAGVTLLRSRDSHVWTRDALRQVVLAPMVQASAPPSDPVAPPLPTDLAFNVDVVASLELSGNANIFVIFEMVNNGPYMIDFSQSVCVIEWVFTDFKSCDVLHCTDGLDGHPERIWGPSPDQTRYCARQRLRGSLNPQEVRWAGFQFYRERMVTEAGQTWMYREPLRVSHGQMRRLRHTVILPRPASANGNHAWRTSRVMQWQIRAKGEEIDATSLWRHEGTGHIDVDARAKEADLSDLIVNLACSRLRIETPPSPHRLLPPQGGEGTRIRNLIADLTALDR